MRSLLGMVFHVVFQLVGSSPVSFMYSSASTGCLLAIGGGMCACFVRG